MPDPNGQEREALAWELAILAALPIRIGNSVYVHREVRRISAALAVREEPRPGTQCGHAGPDGEKEPRFTIKAKDDLALRAVDAYRALCVEEGLTEQAAEVVKAYGEILEWRLWHRDLCHPPDHEHKPVWKAPSSGGDPAVADIEEALGGPGVPLAAREEPRAATHADPAEDIILAAWQAVPGSLKKTPWLAFRAGLRAREDTERPDGQDA